MKIPEWIKPPSFDALLILNILVIIFSIIAFGLGFYWNNPIIVTYSIPFGGFFTVLLVFGLLYRYFTQPGIRQGLKLVTFISIMYVILIFTNEFMPPSSSVFANSGNYIVCAVIGGYICKAVIPDT